jgi:sec-independent protein translocase protein TatB
MLPDIGGSELLIIAAVALIVVGPKDLPILMRKIGQFIGKMRGMASEFRASFDEMARQSELDELRKEVQAMRSGQYIQPFKDAAEAARDVGLDDTFAQIDASLNSGTVQANPFAAAPLPPEPAPLPVEEPAPKPAKPRGAPKVATKAASTKTAAKTQAVAKPKTVAAKTAPAKTAKAAPPKAAASPVKRAAPKPSAEITVTPAKKPRAAAKKSDIVS